MRLCALLAAASAFVLPHSGAAQTAAPEPSTDCSPEGTVHFICVESAPEDLVSVPGTDWVIASAISGDGGLRLISKHDHAVTLLYPSAGVQETLDKKTYDTCPGPLEPDDKAKFITHGLAFGARRQNIYTLYAIHHGKRESVEAFDLDLHAKTPSLTWVGCVVFPDPMGLNALVALPEGGFIAPNYRERGEGAAASLNKMRAGENNGEVWEWHTGKGWRKLPGTEGSGLNGVELSPDAKTLYIASWGSRSFLRWRRGDDPAKRDSLPLGFRVDNLRWSPDGRIFVAGQTEDGTKVVKVDPKTLKVTELIDRANTPAFGFGTVAIQVGNEIWVGSYRSPRIAIFPITDDPGKL